MVNLFELLKDRQRVTSTRYDSFLRKNADFLCTRLVRRLEKVPLPPKDDGEYYERLHLSDSIRSWRCDVRRFLSVSTDVRQVFYRSLYDTIFVFFLCYVDFLERYDGTAKELHDVEKILAILRD